MAEPERVAFGGDEARIGEFPFDAAAAGQRIVGQHGRARAVAEQAGADQNSGVVIHEESRAANFDADGEHSFCAASGENRLARAQVRQGRAAALAHQVEGKYILAQAELFADVAGEAGAQIAGAGADQHGINCFRRTVRIFQGSTRGFGGERRRVRGEAGLQSVGRPVKNFGERFQGKVSRIYAVVPAQDFFEDGL